MKIFKKTSITIESRFVQLKKICLLSCILILVFTCSKDIDPSERAMEISEFIRGLNYDPNEILNVQDIAGETLKTEKETSENATMHNQTLTVCREIKYDLQQNAEQVAILRPTNGIIWPGAIVKINKGLLDGMPEPVTLKPAPATLRIDLPGIESKGTITVNEPSNSNIQTEINKALDWWNNNQYLDGYVNPSNTSYKVATSFSSQQLAMDLGLNVKWASGQASAQFSYTSTSESKVAMMVFKQVFYTITMDTPREPGAVFHPSVDLNQVKQAFSASEPPGYVHSVSYGRIVMFRMTSSESATSFEMEGAMKYNAGVTNVSADMKAKYESILQNSTIDVVTIGGNASVASRAISAENFRDLDEILTGENAVYSKSNPGVPIAYTVKFLSDNKVAKMGYTTDYTATDCFTSHKGTIRVKCSGAYVTRFSVAYKDYQNKSVSWTSTDIRVGAQKLYVIPGGSTSITVKAWAQLGPNIFTKYMDFPEDRCFVTKGDLLFTGVKYEEVDCDF